MKKWRRVALCAALLVGVAVPVLVGCNILVYQFCIFNGTDYILKELNIVKAGDASWGPNDLNSGTPLAAGASEDIKGFSAGSYWVRAIFDVVDPLGSNLCSNTSKSYQVVSQGTNEVFVYSYDLPSITTANLCLDYLVQDIEKCLEIYVNDHFEI
jgi:hypothetical protein